MDLAGRPALLSRASSRHLAVMGLAAWVGFNLRGTVLGVPPVLDRIGSGLGLSHAGLGLLTALPLLCFGVAAIPGAAAVRRWSGHRTVSAGLALVVVGTLLRSLPVGRGTATVLLYCGTLVLSIGIGIAQPALPRVLRDWVPSAVQQAAVCVTLGFIVGQLVAAAATLPLIVPLLRDWRLVLGFWAIPAATALIWWVRQPGDMPPRPDQTVAAAPLSSVLGSRQMWTVAVIMACSNLAFFTANAWLGASAPGGPEGPAAELDLTVFNAASLPVVLLLSSRRRPFVRSRWVYLLPAFATLVGATGWIAEPALGPLWLAVVGAAGTLAFSGAVAFPATLHDPARIAPFSALVWTVGCAAAFAGPLLGGVGIDALHWARAPFLGIAVTGVVMLGCALTLPLHEG